ncbi:MAG TPA: hypothetical protein VEO95_01920 [Chthoniobacteraceae bacterium]|nr:hypothetical protein [Chthoniobacteraceae bacterium]
MKRSLIIAAIAAGLVVAPLHAATDAEVEARRVALELAGAFSNDGFKLRDGVCAGTVEPGKPKIVQVNLYAGNEYWFSLAASGKAKKVAVTVFDEIGRKIDAEPYQEGVTAAAGFSPDASGPYLVKVEVVEGGPSAFCLLYSYK